MQDENVNFSASEETESLDNQIENILSEDETNNENSSNIEEVVEDTNTTEKENTDETPDSVKCPEQFLNTDGTVKLEELLKSYNELEPLANEKAN